MQQSAPCTCVYCRQQLEINDNLPRYLSATHQQILDSHRTGLNRAHERRREREQAQRLRNPRSRFGYTFLEFVTQHYWDRAREQGLPADAVWHPISLRNYHTPANPSLQDRIDEYKEVQLAYRTISEKIRVLPRTMGQASISCTATVFRPLPGLTFSIWHAYVAPRIKPAHRDQVEKVLRLWLEACEQARLAVWRAGTR